ncbi:MAG: hypothetical protein OXG47_03875 [bacterium]|nr:hypothetical protein [bacterium]
MGVQLGSLLRPWRAVLVPRFEERARRLSWRSRRGDRRDYDDRRGIRHTLAENRHPVIYRNLATVEDDESDTPWRRTGTL